MNDQTIRKINTITTGDFVEFEYFRDDEWIQAAISRSALRKLGGPDSTGRDIEVINESRDRIWRAALEQPIDPSKRLMLTSDYF